MESLLTRGDSIDWILVRCQRAWYSRERGKEENAEKKEEEEEEEAFFFFFFSFFFFFFFFFWFSHNPENTHWRLSNIRYIESTWAIKASIGRRYARDQNGSTTRTLDRSNLFYWSILLHWTIPDWLCHFKTKKLTMNILFVSSPNVTRLEIFFTESTLIRLWRAVLR